MIWPEKLYQFTKVQGAVTTYVFKESQTIAASNGWNFEVGVYISNYNQKYHIPIEKLSNYYTSLESCYIAWIESIEKFKQKVINQFENKCKIDYEMYSTRKLLDENPEIKARMKDVLDRMNNGTYWSEKIDV